MRRLWIILLVFIFVLTACGPKEQETQGPKVIVNDEKKASEQDESKQAKEEDRDKQEEKEEVVTEVGGAQDQQQTYSFKVKETDIKPKMKFDEVADSLGEPNETGTSPSCAFEGEDKVYRYDGFDVQTGIVEGNELITGIIFNDETVTTAEDIKIGDSLDKVKETYGPQYVEDIGKYTYNDGNTQLIFIEESGKIIAISYVGVFEE